MNIEEISDMDLRTFCKWYVGFHGTKPVSATVLATCMTGYFSTYAKAEKINELFTIDDKVLTK